MIITRIIIHNHLPEMPHPVSKETSPAFKGGVHVVRGGALKFKPSLCEHPCRPPLTHRTPSAEDWNAGPQAGGWDQSKQNAGVLVHKPMSNLHN